MNEDAKPGISPGRRSAKWIALVLFLLYCLDLAWKLAHWSQYSAGLKISTIIIALAIRLTFMAFLLWMYLRGRKAG